MPYGNIHLYTQNNGYGFPRIIFDLKFFSDHPENWMLSMHIGGDLIAPYEKVVKLGILK